MGLASLLTAPAAAVRMNFLSDAFSEPARKFAKTLDQGIGAIQRLQPGTDIPQPTHIGLTGVLAQRQLGILLLSK